MGTSVLANYGLSEEDARWFIIHGGERYAKTRGFVLAKNGRVLWPATGCMVVMTAIATIEQHHQLVEALQNPGCYQHAVNKVRLVETHISSLLLAGEYVYKLKKPLNLGFLDFSTLERRKFYCQEEIRLNRRLAPEYYLQAVPIYGSISKPVLGDSAQAFDQPVEWAVQMRRFEEGGLLSDLLANNQADAFLVTRLAHQVADFHDALPGQPPLDLGSADQVIAPVDENFRQLAPLLDDLSEQTAMRQVQRWSETTATRLHDFFDQRRAEGFVRECHGDLHAGNLTLDRGKLVLFDCLEFNPALRWIDVISEVAFVTMDFADRNAPQLANRFLNGYLQQTGDYDGLRALSFYEVYRALVRAKVTALRRQQLPTGGDRWRLTSAELDHYLSLAARLQTPPAPALLITHGLSGSGKTYAARRISDATGCIHLRSDLERKRMFGLSALQSSNSDLDNGIYTAKASQQTYDALFKLARQVIAAGRAVLIDAAFLNKSQRDAARKLAEILGCPFKILDLSAPQAVLFKRVTERAATGNDASEAGLAVLVQQLKTFQPLGGDELMDAMPLDTDQPEAIDQVISRICLMQKIF